MDILAAGGRYDGLVRALTEEAGVGEGGEMGDQAGPPSATGVSLAVEKLVGLVAKCPDWQPVRGGVLVGGDRTAAARVAGKLWQAGVTARLECGEVAAGGEDRELLAVTLHSDTTALLSQLDPTTGRTTERKLAGQEVVQQLVSLARRLEDSSVEPGKQPDQITDGRAGRQESVGSTAPALVSYNFQFLDREKYSQSKKKLEVRRSEKLAAALAR